MNLLAAIANRLLKSIHMTPSATAMLSFSPDLHERKAKVKGNSGSLSNCSNVLKGESLFSILPQYDWTFLAFKLFTYLYMLCYLPRALYTFELMIKPEEKPEADDNDTPDDLGDLCDVRNTVVVNSGLGFSSSTFSNIYSASFSSSSSKAIHDHLFFDPVLSTYALNNNIFSYLIIVVNFGLMTLYTLYLDYSVFFRSVQYGPLFREASIFHRGVPLLFNWRRPLSSLKKVLHLAFYLKRNPLAQSSFSWGSFSAPSKFFDRPTIARSIALYQVMNVFFSWLLIVFATIIIFIFFFVMGTVFKVLGRDYWSWQSQWILALAASDQLFTCYMAWNGARISIVGVEAFLGCYYATSRQVMLLDGNQARVLATIEAAQRKEEVSEINNEISLFSRSRSGNPLMVDCFYSSMALHRRQHRRLVIFAEALNSGLISPVLVATFFLNCLVNAAILASFIYVSLSFNDVLTNLIILWFQVVNIGSVCTLCLRYSKALYCRLTSLSFRAVNLSGPRAPPSLLVRVSENGNVGLSSSNQLGSRNWNKGFRVERLKLAAFYESLHQKTSGRGKFHFTVGPMADITTKAVAEFCIQYISYLLFTFTFIRDNIIKKEQ